MTMVEFITTIIDVLEDGLDETDNWEVHRIAGEPTIGVSINGQRWFLEVQEA